MFCQGWLVDFFPLRVVYWETLNLYRKFQFVKDFKVTQHIMTIVRQHFQWLKFNIKIHGMAGIKSTFAARKVGERSHFSETLAGIYSIDPSIYFCLFMAMKNEFDFRSPDIISVMNST